MSTYCSSHHIERYKKRKLKESNANEGSSSKKICLRSSSDGPFKFDKLCLFCGNECQMRPSVKNPNRWREAYLIKKDGNTCFKQKIIKHAQVRRDEWANEVEFRVNSVISDLYAVNGRYHKNCMSKFFTNPPKSCVKNINDIALDELIKQLYSDQSKVWNSVELHNLYKELGGKISRRSLISYIDENFSNDISIFPI